MIEFLKTEQLIYTPIYYYIDDNTKKKTPIGEKNNATIEEINALKEKRRLHFTLPTHKNKKKINDIWTRLWKETEMSLEIAQKLRHHPKVSLEIDMDYNEDKRFFSNKLVPVAKGWANSLGFKVNIKPYRQIATSAADYLSK